MLKKWISSTFLLMAMAVNTIHVYAKDLPDFTELAEKQGPAVVNISITSVAHGNGMAPFRGCQKMKISKNFLNALVFLACRQGKSLVKVGRSTRPSR